MKRVSAYNRMQWRIVVVVSQKNCLYNLRKSLQWELFYNRESFLLLTKDWIHNLKKLVINFFQAQLVDRQTAGTSCKTPKNTSHVYYNWPHESQNLKDHLSYPANKCILLWTNWRHGCPKHLIYQTSLHPNGSLLPLMANSNQQYLK